MDLNDLTPELFEKAEFAERRRGYDIDQVETFLEETGTAVAQLLVRHRKLEERTNSAEARLAEAEARLASRPAEAPVQRAASESDDVERATSTLVMAKRTADATIAEAEAEAARVRNEASSRADSIVSEAHRTAEVELHNARKRSTEVVTSLEARRDAVASVVEGFERRIEEYRDQLGEAADALRAIVDDPSLLTSREPLHVPESALGYTPAAGGAGSFESSGSFEFSGSPEYGTSSEYGASPEQAGSSEQAAVSDAPSHEPEALDLTDATQMHDTATAAREGTSKGAGFGASERSEDSVAGSPSAAGATHQQARESAVIVDAEPVTGQTSDRFLRELDEAVNESAEAERDEDAISAFFDGDRSDGGRSRFGWRR